MVNTKDKFWKILTIMIALFLIYAGVQHFVNAEFYKAFVPDFLNYKLLIIYISGVGIMITGLLMLIPKYNGIGSLLFLVLMMSFLPIHVWDVFSSSPAIGSHSGALIRLPIQLILILISWKLTILNLKNK